MTHARVVFLLISLAAHDVHAREELLFTLHPFIAESSSTERSSTDGGESIKEAHPAASATDSGSLAAAGSFASMCEAASEIQPPSLNDLNSSSIFDYELWPPPGIGRKAIKVAAGHRFWDASSVRSARSVEGDTTRMKIFLSKLYAGKAVTVAALGSSVVARYSGCFGRYSEDGAEELGWSGLLRSNMKDCSIPEGASLQYHSVGYMTHFMRVLNETWPHPDHRFLNVGRTSQSTGAWAAACLHAVVPQEVDLIILELFTIHNEQWHAEFLLRTFLQWPSHPAVVMYNHRVATREREGFRPCYDALWQDLPYRITNPPECSPPERDYDVTHRIWMSLDPFDLRKEMWLVKYHELALHYGVPTVSLAYLLADVEERGLAEDAGLGPVHVQALMNDNEQMHPSPYAGVEAVTDMLLQVILDADAEMRGLCDTTGNIDLEAAEPALHRLDSKTPEPFLKQRCYEPGLPNSFLEAAELMEVEADGFNFNATTIHGPQRDKPGYVTQKPGAQIDIAVQTVFPSHPDAKVEINIAYLASYQRMGKARVECVGGCSCGPITIDAHIEEQKSVNEVSTLPVTTPAPDCALRVFVLDETSSGEHKFKVIQVTVQALGPPP